MTTKPEGKLFALAGLCIVAIAVLTGTGHSIPTILEAVTLGLITGGLGIATPGATQLAPDTAVSNLGQYVAGLEGDFKGAIADLRTDLDKVITAVVSPATAASAPQTAPVSATPAPAAVPTPTVPVTS